jgi:small-conductance mechanosensitive channel
MSENIDVDKLYDDAMNEGESSEIPMDSGVETAAQAETPAPTIPELEFNYKGKQIKTRFDDPKVKQWASQGYDYGQRMQEFTSQREQFENQRKEFSQIEATYKPIDQWAKANPDKWNALFEGWKRESLAGANQQAQLPPEVQQKLQEHDQFLNELKQEKLFQVIQQEDSALDAEIESVKKQFPHIDFSAQTQNGKSLEYRVVEYADKKGINSFADAFYAFNHKNLFNLAEQKGKEAVTQDIQKKTKLGILGKSAAPTRPSGLAQNVESKSYDDLLQEAKREYNIG